MPAPRFAALMLLALGLQAQGLDYRATLRFRGEDGTVETRFRLVPTKPLVTRNRVQKPRMGGWKLELEPPKDASYSPARVLARLERLLYLAGPAPGVEPAPFHVRIDGHNCRAWTVKVPAGLQAQVLLAELRPGLLALGSLRGFFSEGDLAEASLQLERIRLSGHTAPAEEGQALLGTLGRLARSHGGIPPDGEAGLERID